MHTKTVRKFYEWRGLPEEKTPMDLKARQFIKQMVEDELYNDHDCLKKAKKMRDQLDALIDAYYYIEDTCAKHGFDMEEAIERVDGILTKISSRRVKLKKENIEQISKRISALLEKMESSEDALFQEGCLARVVTMLRNTASKMGADIDPLFLIVHAANMRKINPDTGKPWSIREDGKVMKPYKKDGFDFDWYGPEEDLDKELKRQGFR
jgi:predicted HAD superfamily Cof-like phosphohydrolase